MSAYLARLKHLENEKNSRYTPDSEPSKPSKVPFEPFEGTGTGHIEKKIIDDVEIVTPLEPSEIAKPETLQDRQRESRRQKVIAMLDAAPDLQRAIHVDDSSDPHNIILCVAVRHPTRATCEMLISRDKYDPFALLELLMQHETQNVH